MEWENDDSRIQVEDFPDDLTAFITRTTLDYVTGGGFGDVWKCSCNDADGISALVAVKAFRFSERDGLEAINRKISREIGILKMLRHDNIVPLLGIATGFGHMPELRCLVSPWIPNGTLNAYLASNHNLTDLERSCMLKDVGAGLCYLHSVHVMHGDITGENILIDEGGHARLIDFGLSTIIQPLLSQLHLAATYIRPGAIPYAAPEFIVSDDVRELGSLEKTDIYSFGCVMLQILSGRPPWSEFKSEGRQYRIVVMMSKGCGPQRPNGHPPIIDSDWNFIQKCLQFKPELRPSADEVLDFVMHRFSSPDSSRSPVAHAGPGDVTEQYFNSQSSHLNHELKTSITVVDQLFASTSSTPVHSVLPFSHNISSNELSESSTGPGPSGRALKDMFECMWEISHGSHCGHMLCRRDFPSHIQEVHGIHGSTSSHFQCKWNGCGRTLRKDVLLKHMRETHIGLVYTCECGKMFSRRDILNKHKKSCSPSPHPDHELKTLTTMMDKFSASASTSTSSTPAHSVSPIPFKHYLGRESESSTTPGWSDHLSAEPQCMWSDSNGLLCGHVIRGHDISSHLRVIHGIQGRDASLVECRWAGCVKKLQKGSLSRHIKTHLRIVHSCDYGGPNGQ